MFSKDRKKMQEFEEFDIDEIRYDETILDKKT